jgi:hypothetical protein
MATTETDQPTPVKHDTRWKPGQSGNPRGKPPENLGIAELARAHGPEMIKLLSRIAKDRKAPQASRVAAACQLLDRGYGKSPSFSTTDVNDFKRATDMSDEELIRIAIKGGIEIDVPRETKSPADYLVVPTVSQGQPSSKMTKQ